MYKEPFVSEAGNRAMALRIEQKAIEVSARVANPQQDDTAFTANLLDLCVLNRMMESHQPAQKKE